MDPAGKTASVRADPRAEAGDRSMSKFGTSKSVPRKEDVRFLTGKGRYLDDVAPEGAAHAVFLRSPVAHARIVSLDVAEAAAAPGVLAVYVAGDLEGKLRNAMDFSTVKNRDGSRGGEPAAADPRRGPGVLRRRGDGDGGGGDHGRGDGCGGADRLRPRGPAGARGDRRGRAGDPSRGAGERRPSTGPSATRRRSSGSFAAAAHTHAARARSTTG